MMHLNEVNGDYLQQLIEQVLLLLQHLKVVKLLIQLFNGTINDC